MAHIHPTAIVDPKASLGEGVVVGPYCTIGPDATLGDRTRLISHVVIDGRTTLGADCTVHPFAVLGGPPQHLAHKGEPTVLEIGDRNVIREHVTMHTGTVAGGGVTRIGSDGLFMVSSHVAHDCQVSDKVVFAASATLGGHVKIEEGVFLGGLCAVHQWNRVGRFAFVGAGTIVTKDVIPFGSVWGEVHARLEGLNLVGLKRRGFNRDTIHDMRAAYRLLFANEGTLQERVEDVAETYGGSPEVSEIIAFIRADASRPLCLPSD
ncbi:acyl-ACP--UDP-N-acetylglucosamine O-acyltransferase [soil metagenome]